MATLTITPAGDSKTLTVTHDGDVKTLGVTQTVESKTLTITTGIGPAGADGTSGGGDMLAATYDPTTVAGDAFDMDNMVEGTAKILTAAERTILGNTSGTNTGDQTIPASGVDFDPVGTDNSTDVTLGGTGTYITIAGQVITVDPITESDISDFGSYLASTDIDTLAELNAIVGDATLIDTGDARLSDARTPTAHAASHTDGSDDIRSATNAQTGLATGTHITAIEASTAHISDTTAAHAGSAISFDSAGLVVLTATDVQTAIEQTDEALISTRSTGLRNGGNISDQGLGVIRIAAGRADILLNADPADPVHCACPFVQTDIDLSGVSNAIYFIYVDVNGDVLSTTVAPTSSSRRVNSYLWRVSIIGGLFSAATSICNPIQQYGQGIADVFEALGLVRTGLALSAVTTDLTIAVSAGSIYQSGANFHTSAIDPNKTTYIAKSPATIRLFTQNNTQGTDRTTLDVANYDLSGTVTSIPGSASRAQIWTVLQFPSVGGEIRIAYGQSYYSSITAAQTALTSGTYSPVIPSAKSGAIVIGYIITAANATDLSDGTQVFITTNRFGLIGGSVSSSGATPLLAANDLSDLANAGTARTNLGVDAAGTDNSDNNAINTLYSGLVTNATHTGEVTGSGALTISSAILTTAARTVTDDVSVAAMVDTLGGASSTGTGGLVRATSPTLVTPLLGTPTSGNLANCTNASTTAAGVVELATSAEISTGTDTVRAISPDGLEASTYNWHGPAGIALSDESTALTASTSVPLATFHAQRAFTLINAPFGVTVAPTGSTMTFDIHKNGTTIFSTKPTIDASEKTTATAATAAVLSATSFAAGDLIEVFVDSIGATIAGAGAKAYFNCKHPTS